MRDDTADLQARVARDPVVSLEPGYHYGIDGKLGIRIPSDRIIRGNGATVELLPGCTSHCKAFETVPGSENIRLLDMTVIGDLKPAPGFSIGFRGDSVRNLSLENITFRNWRFDGIWLGGNLGTHNAWLRNVTVEDFGRNGVSVVNGSGFVFDRYTARRSTPETILGAGIDVENNPGDLVRDVTILNSLVEDAVTGYYLHGPRGQGHGLRLINSVARNCKRYGVIVNSFAHVTILDNLVVAPPTVAGQPVPVGISVGATGLITSDDVTIAGNKVQGTVRAAILAGVKDTRVIGNDWGIGSLLTVAPSASVPATAGVQFSVP